MKVFKKDLGFGTLSIFLFIIGAVLVFEYAYFTIGESILSFLGFRQVPSLELLNPNSVYISLAFILPSIALGYAFKDHFGAKVGRALSLSLVLILLAWFIGFNIGYNNLYYKFF